MYTFPSYEKVTATKIALITFNPEKREIKFAEYNNTQRDGMDL